MGSADVNVSRFSSSIELDSAAGSEDGSVVLVRVASLDGSVLSCLVVSLMGRVLVVVSSETGRAA